MRILLPALALVTACVAPAATDPHPLHPRADPSRYDLVWDTPGPDHNASVPLGNGSTGINAWVETNGDLVFYLGRGDSWSENGRLLKLGRVRVRLEPPLDPAVFFQQRLNLAAGALEIHADEGSDRVDLRLWVDAHHPRVEVECTSASPRTAVVSLEPWRTEPMVYPQAATSDLLEDRSKPNRLHQQIVVRPDTVIPARGNRIGWYHHNLESVGPALIARLQGLDGYLSQRPDPLLHRIFGGMVEADGAFARKDRELVLAAGRTHRIAVTVASGFAESTEAWLATLEGTLAAVDQSPVAARWAAHQDWWHRFWNRSWIHVTEAGRRGSVPVNEHPLRIGRDQQGGNRFVGTIGRVQVFDRAVDPGRIAALAAAEPPPGPPATEIEGRIADPTFAEGLTVTAWIRPGQLPAGGGRILDKVTPGVNDGWLFDTFPGNGLRLIAGPLVISCADVLPTDRWVHVAARYEPHSGDATLFVNGQPVATERSIHLDDAAVVSRAYALQRYVNACAGRGAYPIKYNGSIFTVPSPGQFGDADYRKWGPGYWWQNTRLIYLGMCASGDFDLMRPLFRMYADQLLDLHRYRTRQYTGHEGAFIPECIYFWGPTFTTVYGWTPFAERGEDKLQQSPWHKREWVSGLELVWMMLDYYAHTEDRNFLVHSLLPTAREILTFFDQHYGDGPDGRMHMEPSMALETWWDTTDPMPEVAGLHAVVEALLALPPEQTSAKDRAFWQRLAKRLPELPTREIDGIRMLAPAARFANKQNVENPELYAVFPFQRVTAFRGDRQLGIAALEARTDRGAYGWRQDDLFMTHLGLAEDARRNLVARARRIHPESRFPAFWGPNYDWVPDQCHGGVLVRTLQTMLLQGEQGQIHLLPAWPSDWDVDFQLHLPEKRQIRGVYRHGVWQEQAITAADAP